MLSDSSSDLSLNLLPELMSQYASLDDLPVNHIDSVLALRLDDVEEDPDQPRREFREEPLMRLADDMASHGQRVPIIVRPAVNGVHRIVHGARRYRVAKRANWAHIRAIVEKDGARCDDFAQWAENAKRDDLTPNEIALFIDKHLQVGRTKQEIAVRMGESPTFISLHLALLTAPSPIRAAHDAGHIPAVRSVYELCRLHQTWPDAIASFVASHDDITYGGVRQLAAELTGKATLGTSTQEHAASQIASDVDGCVDGTDVLNGFPAGLGSRVSRDVSRSPDIAPRTLTPKPHERSALVGATKRGRTSSEPRFDAPLLKAVHQDRQITVLLDRRRSAASLVCVEYESDGDVREVDMATVTNLFLANAQV
jgi:ParB family chromosome partitioning protein